jgi:hypothetical protein
MCDVGSTCVPIAEVKCPAGFFKDTTVAGGPSCCKPCKDSCCKECDLSGECKQKGCATKDFLPLVHKYNILSHFEPKLHSNNRKISYSKDFDDLKC